MHTSDLPASEFDALCVDEASKLTRSCNANEA